MRKKKISNAPMTGEELWANLQKLGFKQQGFAKTIKKTDRAVRTWIADDYPVPQEIALLVNLMLKFKVTAEDLQG